MAVRVFLVEPLLLVCQGLRCLLAGRGGPELVGEARDAEQALPLLRRRPADVTILSVTLPIGRSLESIRRLRWELPAVRLLALTDRHEDLLSAELLKAGAAGVLPKACGLPDLLDAVNAVAAGQGYLWSAPADEPAWSASAAQRPWAAQQDPLTARQRQIVRAVADGKTTRQIAAALGITVKTVEAHRHHIAQRLRLRSIAGLIKYALREGLTSLDV